MRVATWNLDGSWSPRHTSLLVAQDCDVWLLTEVPRDLSITGFTVHPTVQSMTGDRAWSAVASRWPLVAAADPHPCSAMAMVEGVALVCSVLPWRTAGALFPAKGDTAAERTASTVRRLAEQFPTVPLVWGGDWNHELSGRLYAGTRGGRDAIESLLVSRGLSALTRDLPAAVGNRTIDHLACSRELTGTAEHVVAVVDGCRLSDHDPYVAELSLDPTR